MDAGKVTVRVRDALVNPARAYLANQFVWGTTFSLMSVVYMIYQVDTVGLNPLQLVLVGTALELSALMFEVPTGLLADLVSRKISVLMGYMLTGISFVLAGLFPVYEVLIAAAFLWGIGWTFVSGAHTAWITDEVGVLKAGELIVRGAKLSSYGAFVGILVGVLIASLGQLHWPLLLSGLVLIFWTGVGALTMTETWRPNAPGKQKGQIQVWGQFIGGINAIKASTTLVLLMSIAVIFGGFSEGFDRLSVAHLMRNYPFPDNPGPVIVFGVLAALGNLISMGALSYTEKRLDTLDTTKVAVALSILFAGLLVAVLLFALSGWLLLALLLYVMIIPLRRVIDPLITAWLNQQVSSGQRATVLSMHGQCDALGQTFAGPGVGMVANSYSIPVGMCVSALILAPAIWLFRRSKPIELESDK